MGFGFIFMLVFLALLIAGVVLAVRWVSGVGDGLSAEPRESALDILRKRYARGEMSKEEFEAKKKDLV
ncbi:MAG: SHOCT domain-containing protein [Chloroflexi bacterium]|nr:SHOCT domain-containing protein [Chloroflexota bacterium]